MKPAWLDATLYPFEPRYLDLEAGRLHYVDEGAGEPVVFVHGTPTWSFLWRHPIQALRGAYRCVALDHLGFGLSDKPEGADYTPAAHAARFDTLVDRLGLRDVTLVVHDFGGPIGLSHAVTRPENVRRIVVMNTWLWSNQGNRSVEWASRILAGGVGRFLYTRLNVSPRVLLRHAYADKRKLTKTIHGHYTGPFTNPAERFAPWVLARELTGSNDWYASLWERRHHLRGKPMAIVWGLADPLVGRAHLDRWRTAFPGAEVVALERVGHFVTEEAPERAVQAIGALLRDDLASREA